MLFPFALSAFVLALISLGTFCLSFFYDEINFHETIIGLVISAISAIASVGMTIANRDIQSTVRNAKALKKEVDRLTEDILQLYRNHSDEKLKLNKLKVNIDENYPNDNNFMLEVEDIFNKKARNLGLRLAPPLSQDKKSQTCT